MVFLFITISYCFVIFLNISHFHGIHINNFIFLINSIICIYFFISFRYSTLGFLLNKKMHNRIFNLPMDNLTKSEMN